MIMFSARIKELRLDKQLSQADLAKAMSVNQRTISNWKNLCASPILKRLQCLQSFFR